MPEPFRITPIGPPQAFQTYEARRPVKTHYRKASCAEAECSAWLGGWLTRCDTATELGARQANYIRLHSGRRFTVTEQGTMVTFAFPAGQTCFAEHKVSLDRPALYVVRGGDWRSNTGIIRRHTSVESFVDDMHETTERIAQWRK